MELAKMEVTRAEIRKVHRGKLTSGMVGAEVAFSFDDAWDGLNRIAVFKAGGTVKDVLLVGEICVIPHEVLERPVHLVVGVYGTDADGSVVIPTVWADLGMVEQGAKPSGEISKKPTPEVWAQILGMIGDLKKLNTEDKSSLVAAINEVLRKGADPEEVERIVSAYLAENGIGGGIHIGPYPPDDPNVDIWLDTSEEETPPYIPNTINAKPGQIVRVVTVDENGAIVAVEAVDMPSGGESYELPVATADALGGIKADPATEGDTQPVRIGADGMLFTTPGGGGGGGGEKWETINEAEVEDVVMTELDCNFDDYKKVAIMLDGFGTKTAGRVNAHFGYDDSNALKQICQFIGTTNDKRCGYVSIDTATGQIVFTQGCNWAYGGTPLMTTTDSMSIRNHVGATKVIIMAIDSAAAGATPSATNTMMGKIKIVGVRK